MAAWRTAVRMIIVGSYSKTENRKINPKLHFVELTQL